MVDREFNASALSRSLRTAYIGYVCDGGMPRRLLTKQNLVHYRLYVGYFSPCERELDLMDR